MSRGAGVDLSSAVFQFACKIIYFESHTNFIPGNLRLAGRKQKKREKRVLEASICGWERERLTVSQKNCQLP